MGVALIADFDTTVGFKLAGLKKAYTISDGKEAEEVIRKLSKASEVRIIIITESLANQIRQYIKELYKKEFPIIVEIPDKGGFSTTAEFIRNIIKKTIGIEVLIS
ncbi:MAG: V-type ATP synthase subunit F [Candidatus Verstraetearchaeota archaeon]|jgi:V/A-type H+-transporting ATPase subunit F|nr:V-type ATP synthase subunit F [Candidatus Verstraetearchaeota archaeon]